jgi:hypothetical protein
MRSLFLNQVVAIFCDEVIVVLSDKISNGDDHRNIAYDNTSAYDYAALDLYHDMVMVMSPESNVKLLPFLTNCVAIVLNHMMLPLVLASVTAMATAGNQSAVAAPNVTATFDATVPADGVAKVTLSLV